MSSEESNCLADDIAKAEEAMWEFYRELKAIPWWQFRKSGEIATRYNKQVRLVNRMKWRDMPITTIHIEFTDGTYKDVMGYRYVVDSNMLKIQTSNRQGGPESYEFYPLVNIKQWSV